SAACSLFPFACSRVHLDFHSFPTRRSSDLRQRLGPAGLVNNALDPAQFEAALQDGFFHSGQHDEGGNQVGGSQQHGHVDVIPVRSEEHTSELQSRENLVCRLLLEKKQQQHQ